MEARLSLIENSLANDGKSCAVLIINVVTCAENITANVAGNVS